MDAFIVKKPRHGTNNEERHHATTREVHEESANGTNDEESTEIKLAMLASILSDYDQGTLFEALLSCDGSVEAAVLMLTSSANSSTISKKRKTPATIGYQSSLSSFLPSSTTVNTPTNFPTSSRPLTKKGKTLYLYSPTDIASHTPCSLIHNFLPPSLASSLLHELLAESKTFTRETFRLFDNVVTSPHSMSFYVDDFDLEAQRTEYVYNGSRIADVRATPPQMRAVSVLVREAVNKEIQKRIVSHQGGRKLPFQSPERWEPNTAFVNCYDGGKESVGYHADQLTYLGPRAVIGGLSLGVAREFRVRRVVGRDADEDGGLEANKKRMSDADTKRADTEGQISIHLPHNSLLVMHAEMQEEWKHAIAPAQRIDPHPIAGNKRLNVTYRCYRASLHPKYTPRCNCGVPTVLRCVMRKKETRGKYVWMCHAGYTQDKSCSFFQWAEFDDDGNPPWANKVTATPSNTASVAAVESAIETASTSTPAQAEQDIEPPLG